MPLPPSPALLDALRHIVGDKGFTTSPQDMAIWLTDWRGKYHGKAAAMLSPNSTAQVSQIMKLCHDARVAVVPQGGNSGMVGGATPDHSGDQILLCLRRMTGVRHIDVDARLACVDAGVILENFHHIALDHGLRFPLTLGGKGSATIGGLVSTNAGGTQVLRHGNMRELVAGLEVVLPDGQILDALSPLKKDNRGYDLRHLFCGAEGTLGIVTAATLRLSPSAPARQTAWVGLTNVHQALVLLRQLDRGLGAMLEGFEILPQSCLTAVLNHIPNSRNPLESDHIWYALIELAGDDQDIMASALERELAQALEASLIQDAVIAKNDQESDDFWRIRDSISAASRAEGPAIQHDISVPVEKMPEFIESNPARLSANFAGVRCLSFGHLGDGNVHHHIQPPVGVDGQKWLAQYGEEASRAVYRHVMEIGGSISAEHGIGQMKRDILAELDSPARLAALRAIKLGMDPHQICNPDKLIRLQN
ncbi:FAD-binding oxidoreductase [Sphingopyxis yananensis]|uniref:FAD-binding oxidoreductase n=1 Tax=Sphingopyxis yananensis TaxID=2886687 RepID=UPI001D0FE785|nr:FAD-binding oxidoreductase [Sphingopyxis yananensis]MCC2600906.1 FAD-binding oxidoreductase [Sphingopyxis yananensis]